MVLTAEGLSPNKEIVNVLRGTISEPVQTVSQKPGEQGQLVTVRLALEGPGMWGLSNWKDNREWSGILGHCFLSARYATHFAQKMAEADHKINPQLILDGMIVSHPGRRPWDEAGWYPDVVPDAAARRAITNETLGLRLISGRVPDNIFQFVAALAFSDEFPVDQKIYDSWEHRLSILADHRTSDRYLPLHVRMGGFLLGNFFNREGSTPELKKQVHRALDDILTRQRNYRLGITGGQGVNVEEAAEIIQSLGASPVSPRDTLRVQLDNVLRDAETEADLNQAGIDPDNINDQIVPMSAWEETLRHEYVAAARESIVGRLSGLHEAIDMDFPPNTWWGKYALGIFEETKN